MTAPHESGRARTDLVVDPRTTKDPTKQHITLRGREEHLKQYSGYGSWFWRDYVAAPEFNVAIVAGERDPSWASVEEATFLFPNISYAEHLKSGEVVAEQLRQRLGALFGHSHGMNEIREELATLKQLIVGLSAKVDAVGTSLVQTVCYPIESFVPEPLEVASPMSIVISPEDDGFQASYLDGNLHAYGESREEALTNIKASIVDAYRRLRGVPDSQLGRSMLRQKKVLNHHLREAGTA